ncbi:MAG: alcohol dehydrogenase catalytic domain-containing protein [Ilumatobacter sp.]|uniref:alcohol dehydrogenase catalytic domain-containing protein n=1 Tax=Ilumatobacter sp. TaxID=1967498 RepID=UPI002635EC4A|nr:alcohol dehydrogenase catalytic domain-containing protein [Ilumatobacter sp.]MDJ0769841.1 alcohol dehydrogenase catalytic domain-containing protein [Ilumatobacter sp.]
MSRAFGERLTIEPLTLADAGPGEVRVALAAVAVCHSDVSYADGEWGGELPAVWGHEAAGTIVEVGADVGFAVGQRVVVTLIRSCGECHRCQRGAEIACTASLDRASPLTDADGREVGQGLRTAAFAEQVVVDASQVVPFDDEIPMTSASLLACGVITGVGAVLNTAKVEPGSSVVVLGCGGVGLNVVQGAALAGASPIIAVDPQESKHDLAIHLGATHAVSPADLQALVTELTGGLLADYVFVATGAPTALASAPVLAGAMSAIVIVGMPPTGVTGQFDPGSLAGENQRILGSKMGTSVIARDIPALVTRYLDGELELDDLVSRTFPLEQINEAMDEVRKGTALRNVIVFDDA